LLVLAASSAPSRLWTIDLPESGPSATDPAATPSTLAPRAPDQGDLSDPRPGNSPWLWVIGLPFLALAVAATIAVRPELGWRWTSRERSRGRRGRAVAPLPEIAVDPPPITIDAVAARQALTAGSPRNAIVACWMQLEHDAEAAGLPRGEAETSAEYAERLIGASSVDAAPIGRLAALYREARFSRHELSDDHRARAVDALDRVVDAL
jgi:hypothetical protein